MMQTRDQETLLGYSEVRPNSSPMYVQLPEAYGKGRPNDERRQCRRPHYVHVAAVTGINVSLDFEPQTPSKTTIPTQWLMEHPPGLFLPPPTECPFTSPPPLRPQQTANPAQELNELSLQIDWLKKDIAALEAYADAERFYVKLVRASALEKPCEVPRPRPPVDGSDVPELPTRKPAQASCGIWSGLNNSTGSLEIQWIATARKLTSNDRVFTSPDFKILGMRFKMFVCARPTDGGLTGSFRHASGFGHVFLKYEAQSPHEDLSLEFRLSVGTRSQEVRVQHNFGRMATWGPSGAPAWDLSAAVDRQSMTLRILLEVWGDSM